MFYTLGQVDVSDNVCQSRRPSGYSPFRVLDLSAVNTTFSAQLVEAVILYPSLPRYFVFAQEQCQAGVCPPTMALKSTRPTPKQQVLAQSKVMSYNSCEACRANTVQTVIVCVLVSVKLWGASWDVSNVCCQSSAFQVGLSACGIGQECGKENADPAPKGKPPRTPRAKNVSYVFVKQSRCVGAVRFRLPILGALRTPDFSVHWSVRGW